MKKIVLFLMMGISVASYAAVAPVNARAVRKPSVTQPDATKMKMMVKPKPLSDSVGSERIADLQRYGGVVTMDNVKAIENMSRLMQDDPNRLMEQFGVDTSQLDFEVDRRKLGSDEIVGAYVASPETDDPAEKLAGLNTPDLTGTFESARASEEELLALHRSALRQIEEIGHEHLGEKAAPIRMPMTVDEIKEMGIDTRRLPRGWEEALRETEKNQKLYQEQEARKKTGAKKEDSSASTEKVTVQPQKKQTQQPQNKKTSVRTTSRKK